VNTEGGLVVEWGACDASRCENLDASQVDTGGDNGSNSGGKNSALSGSMIGLFVFVFCASMVLLVGATDRSRYRANGFTRSPFLHSIVTHGLLKVTDLDGRM
jgi:hypothetical protein